MHRIRDISDHQVQCFGLQSAAVAAMLLFGPEDQGGFGDLHEKVEVIFAQSDSEADRFEKLEKVIRGSLSL